MPHRLRRLCGLVAAAPLALAAACASPQAPPVSPTLAMARSAPVGAALRAEAARQALALLGTPYRYGGGSPQGFDCSGLVVYSYAAAGLPGLPHSAAALERRARPVPLSELEPGDLLFFDLHGRKASHVALYLGGRVFLHAPSAGKRVERVGFDHVYWGPRIRRAGRLVD